MIFSIFLANLIPKLQYGTQKQLGLLDTLRDARPILDIAGCELIFTKSASRTSGVGRYIIYIDGRYYGANVRGAEGVFSKSRHYIY